MDDAYQQVDRLQREANALPRGPTQVALLEEAVQHADLLQDVDLGWNVRHDLMTAAVFAGRPDIVLVAFAWCLAQYDRALGRFDQHRLLWKYKWVLDDVRHFPEIDRARLEQLFADLERRYRAAGASLHAVCKLRRDLAVASGERTAAEAADAELRRQRRDSYSDCAACVASDDITYSALLERWDEAVQAAQPLVAGRLTCGEEPHRALSRVLEPLLHLGRVDEARELQKRGYRLIGHVNHFVVETALHLRCAVLLGDLAEAKRLVERHLAGTLDSVMLDERFAWLIAARLWTDRLLGLGTDTIKVRLPAALPAADAEGQSDVKQLGAWLTEQAQAIARRFDARNGNDYYQRQIDQLPSVLELAVD